MTVPSATLSSTGQLKLTLRNSNDFDVTGSAQLKSTNPIAAQRRKPRPKRVTFATKAFRISPGGRVTVTLKLSRSKLATVKKLKSVKATLTLTLRDPSGDSRTVSRKVTLKAPKPKRNRRRG